MEPPSDDEIRQDIAQMIDVQVRTGFRDFDEILGYADDLAQESENPGPLRGFAAELLSAAWRKQRFAEQSWVGRTDCERLDQAFDELEATGIVARQDFTCCGNCGVAEIGGEAQIVEQRGVKVRGYAFYHQLDTESAVEGRGVYLSYGSAGGGEAASLAIGREIVSVLESQGLAPRWDGSLAKRIELPLEWRRRFQCS